MCFCMIEFEKRSHRIAQDIFLFLLWISDTLPVQSSCFAPEMISLLRNAKIIFQEPVVITATTSNKFDSGRSCYYCLVQPWSPSYPQGHVELTLILQMAPSPLQIGGGGSPFSFPKKHIFQSIICIFENRQLKYKHFSHIFNNFWALRTSNWQKIR